MNLTRLLLALLLPTLSFAIHCSSKQCTDDTASKKNCVEQEVCQTARNKYAWVGTFICSIFIFGVLGLLYYRERKEYQEADQYIIEQEKKRDEITEKNNDVNYGLISVKPQPCQNSFKEIELEDQRCKDI